MRNVRMRRVLERVAAAFNRAGVPLLVMKGGALILTVYGLDERPMDDLDLLVRPEHFREACRVLEHLGARAGRPLLRGDFCPRFYYETEFFLGTVDAVKIDLHVRPFRPLPCAKFVPADALWGGSRELSLGNSAVRIPGAEDMLIHLAVHAAFHGCARRMWMQDISVWSGQYRLEIDWSRVLATVETWRLVLPFRVGMAKAAEAHGPTCPVHVMRELLRRRAGWRERLVLWEAPRDAGHPVAHVLVNFLCTPGWRFPLEYLAAVAFPDESHWQSKGGRFGRMDCVRRWGQQAWARFGALRRQVDRGPVLAGGLEELR